MSTQLPPPSPTASKEEVEIKIISHSHLFYWWPVWAIGYLLTLLTWIDGGYMIVVPGPEHSEVSRTFQVVADGDGRTETREGVLIKKAQDEKRQHHLLPDEKNADGSLPPPSPIKVHMAGTSAYGVIFAITLLLVTVITNVPLRGLWSVVIIITIGLGTVILALTPALAWIIQKFLLLDIRINMGGYFFVSTVLFIVWLITFVFFDRQMYILFSPGSMKVCTEIGGGEKAYDTMGMTLEKKRSDLFRHWILGLGSGDLIVNTAGAAVQHFDLPNVLFIGKKVQMVEDMLREKAVVKGR